MSPLYGGVIIHRPEDVDILYTGEPVAVGHIEKPLETVSGTCLLWPCMIKIQ